MTQQTGLEALSTESRRFEPPAELAASANVTAEAYERAAADRLGFWAEQAERLQWDTPWDEVLDWQPPFAKWFVGGKLNVAVNCVDRHVDAGHGDRVALHWVGEPEDDTRDITYAELQAPGLQAANALERARRQRRRPRLHLPADGARGGHLDARLRPHRRRPHGRVRRLLRRRRWSTGSPTPRPRSSSPPTAATAAAPRARSSRPSTRRSSAARRSRTSSSSSAPSRTSSGSRAATCGGTTSSTAQPEEHEAQAFDAEQPLFLLYTSGTTGKPKGILHTSGGYLTQAAWTHWAVFDLKPETDVYWCTADVGWVTGHSYLTYGPLANGATQVMYEGTPDAGGRDRWWSIVEKYGVTILYTAPDGDPDVHEVGRGAARASTTCRRCGCSARSVSRSTRRPGCGTAGSSAATAARSSTPGGRPRPARSWSARCRASPSTKPGSAMGPLPGIVVDVVDGEGVSVGETGGGFLTLSEPWPSMLRGIWGDDERYRDTYWSRFEGQYFAGDGAKWDDEHVLWLLGRVDDVMNISGHRISTTEVESALVSHPKVAEAAVVGAADPTTGQAIVAFVTVKGDVTDDESGAEGFVHGAAQPRRQGDRRDRQAAADRASRPSCPRPAAARSCAGCSSTSPSAASSAT